MRRLLLLGYLAAAAPVSSQEKPESAVTGYAALSLGLTASEETVPIGVVGVDRRSWHFLARYRYEDKDTFSGWVGRVFQTGDRVALTVTPVAGLVLGLTDGAGPPQGSSSS